MPGRWRCAWWERERFALRVVRVAQLRLTDVIDTHCHLTFPDFASRVDDALAEGARAGVSGCITISTTTRDCLEALALAESHERVWCTSGVHPLHSHEGPHDWSAIARVAAHAKCVAWGELGLDNHYAEPARDVQRAVLHEQLELIRACRAGSGFSWGASAWSAGGSVAPGAPIDKPLVIHSREASSDLIPVLRSSGLEPTRMVFHCFTGGPDEARAVLDFGAWISFTGVVTYKNAAEVRAAARLVPAERIMVETDAPFLSPEPVRRERPCRPAFTRHTAEALAALRGVAFESFHAQVNENTRRFFGIDAR